MKHTTRELLVTTKVAESWQNFDSNVDGLMSLVSKVDNETHVESVTELLDVYHSKAEEPAGQQPPKKQVSSGRPFEFTIFRN